MTIVIAFDNNYSFGEGKKRREEEVKLQRID